jgi:hypothetical protein
MIIMLHCCISWMTFVMFARHFAELTVLGYIYTIYIQQIMLSPGKLSWYDMTDHEMKKKIWCASRARVNLPHIDSGKCIKFVLKRFFLNKTQGFTFLSRNMYGWVGYPSDIKFQNFEFAVLSLAKLPSDLFFGGICLTKLKVFTFLSRNLYGRYPKDDKLQNSEYFFRFLDPNIITKNAVRSVLGWNLLNQTQGFYLS